MAKRRAPINASTSHRRLANVLDSIRPGLSADNPRPYGKHNCIFYLEPHQWEAVQEAAQRARDRVIEGADRD